MRIYCISGQGTAWENADVRAAEGVGEIMCIRAIGGLFYCPDLKVVFLRNCEPEQLVDEYHKQYDWEYAQFPYLDTLFNRLKENPFWEMEVCRIDAPKPQPITDEELVDYL